MKAAFHFVSRITACACIALASEHAAAQESESYLEPEPGAEQEESSDAFADVEGEADVPDVMHGLRVHGGVLLGAGGSADYDPGGGSEPMGVTYGVVAGADYALTRYSPYFAVGAEFRLGFWTVDYLADSGVDRSTWIDLALKPRARYELGKTLEVYGVLPLGPSYVIPAEGADQDSSFGFNLGIGPGSTLMLNNVLGVNLELLYLWRWYAVKSQIAGEGDGTEKLGQLTFFANFVAQL